MADKTEIASNSLQKLLEESGLLETQKRRRADEDAYQQARRKLISFARTRGAKSDEAENIVDEAFIRLVTRDDIDLTGNVAGWMYTVVKNLVIDNSRKERKSRSMVDIEHHAGIADKSGHKDYEVIEQRTNARNIIENAGLTPDAERILYLKYGEGLNTQEIARILRTTPRAVLSSIHRSVNKLRTTAAHDKILNNPSKKQSS